MTMFKSYCKVDRRASHLRANKGTPRKIRDKANRDRKKAMAQAQAGPALTGLPPIPPQENGGGECSPSPQPVPFLDIGHKDTTFPQPEQFSDIGQGAIQPDMGNDLGELETGGRPLRMRRDVKMFLVAYFLNPDKRAAWKFSGHNERGKLVDARIERILGSEEAKGYLEAIRVTLADTDVLNVDWIMKEVKDNLEEAKRSKKCGDVNKCLELLANYSSLCSGVVGGNLEEAMGEGEYEVWLRNELSRIERGKVVGVALAV